MAMKRDLLGIVLAMGMVACGGTPEKSRSDGSTDHPGSGGAPGGGGCSQFPGFNCTLGARTAQGGTLCFVDIDDNPSCVNGSWQCGSTEIARDGCTCYEPAPSAGCTICTLTGWQCDDGGVDGAGDDATDAGDGG